ncbi:N-acetylglucosamine-6-phosphate deacetylase [Acidaminococcus sp.]|uniref:N-acetylglucosamine-6-phosphate deacetylase n=1 Tax=Acidaminococcus sp. TaxID=1872103 RepID=UPI003D7D8CC4
MKAIINGRFILPQEITEGQALTFDKTLQGFTDPDQLPADTEIIDAQGAYVAPGFLNIHIHGCGGSDAMDGTREALDTMSRLLASTGVTGFLPTTMTCSEEAIDRALSAIRDAQGHEPGAEILGANLEGPFISEKYKGAQKACHIQKAHWESIEPYADILKILTLAPETLTDMEFIPRCCSHKIIVSLGHSDATFEEAARAISAGASHITHLYNAMSPLHHRRPGLVGAALTQPVTCELIADGIHIHPAALSLAVHAKGLDKIVLITDSMRACLLGEGESELGGQKVFVRDGRATLADGTLAGSILTMEKAVQNIWKFAHLTLPQAVQLATANPARELGFSDRGTLKTGQRADLAIFDDDFNILQTYKKGTCIFHR